MSTLKQIGVSEQSIRLMVSMLFSYQRLDLIPGDPDLLPAGTGADFIPESIDIDGYSR